MRFLLLQKTAGTKKDRLCTTETVQRRGLYHSLCRSAAWPVLFCFFQCQVIETCKHNAAANNVAQRDWQKIINKNAGPIQTVHLCGSDAEKVCGGLRVVGVAFGEKS